MKPTKEELNILRLYARLSHQEDKYVWLRQDEKGTYIEYAFKEGVPHDNRCLSWYFSLQPNALKRNGKAFGHETEEIEKEIEWRKKRIEDRVDNLFTLSSFTCGHEEYPESTLSDIENEWKKYHEEEPFIKEDHICRVGCPARACIKNMTCAHWTYEEPVKCACWNLSEVNSLPTHVSISMDDAVRLEKYLIHTEGES